MENCNNDYNYYLTIKDEQLDKFAELVATKLAEKLKK
jgi:hypothetical protein